MHKLGLELILPHAGTADPHDPLVGIGCDLRRLAHGLELGTALVEPQFVQQVVQRDELHWTVDPGAGLGANLLDPVADDNPRT